MPLDPRSARTHLVSFGCVGYDEHKEGGWLPSKKKKGCGCKGAKGTKVVVPPPVPMEEVADPRPEFKEPKVELVDNGRVLEPMPVGSEGTLFN